MIIRFDPGKIRAWSSSLGETAAQLRRLEHRNAAPGNGGFRATEAIASLSRDLGEEARRLVEAVESDGEAMLATAASYESVEDSAESSSRSYFGGMDA